MNPASSTPETRFAALVEAFLDDPYVTPPSEWKGFGASGLKVHQKIFAMLSSDGRFVVKLPRQRVDSLTASGDGQRFEPRHNGRPMKEWLALAPTSQVDWLTLAKEALEFVASQR